MRGRCTLLPLLFAAVLLGSACDRARSGSSADALAGVVDALDAAPVEEVPADAGVAVDAAAADPAAAAPDATVADAAMADAVAAVDAAAAEPAAFDPASVPVTTVGLPPFPFFKAPDGLQSSYREPQREIAHDGQYFLAGDKAVLVEGRIFRDRFALTRAARPYSELEFHRNYENAIAALGGRRIDAVQYTREVVAAAGGRGAIDKHQHGAAAVPGYRHDSYLLRTPDKEYWIDVSTGAIPLHGYVVVLERQAMVQSLGFLDAAAMRQAIDQDGRVALHINFDTDKATLRQDAQPTIAEIGKLLADDPALQLSIEGHTDASGEAAHNQALSTARARSVLGALVGLGVDPARLQSRGYGQERPVADNASEAGRAANRRVELVRR